jgi:deoxyribodipyrimidine photo-lyase
MVSLFLFHRDFRIVDNTSLIELSTLSDSIIPIFIFNPDQVDPLKNKYYNENSVQFMGECLFDIPHLQIFYGYTEDVLESIYKKHKITHIGFNLDYTPYAIKRTQKVKSVSNKYNVKVVCKEDYTALSLDQYRDQGFYKVFKPFFEHLLTLKIRKPNYTKITFTHKKLSSIKLPETNERHREDALIILKSNFDDYETTRNIPSIETTHLSKHIKFGTVSIREVYHAFYHNRELLRQVAWHDHYACLLKYLPVKDTIGGGNVKHVKKKWKKNETHFKKWCKGETGYPLVDAGMRQLNETGWMHNRVRLIVSNFLTLKMGIDWKKGEKYFAQKLVDYDVASNNLNWQFSVGVGTDRNQFIRIYNPFLQSKKYDPECIYIKKWVKELKDVPAKDIHQWDKKYDLYNVYFEPIKLNK